ncbi:ethylene-responsive transcription factor ERF017-like [Ipomoea triloba]|uniref:ethylene-responsive transcription factor ERF017-like n=1 Tax=Ipomoea triloba TaxID=35885 RepID=UPI00125D5738|nr:ethylene-responsive transcription factor ERF017-like [Ipomoea triloba]
MVKPKRQTAEIINEPDSSLSCKYRGVRKRKWGKWVSEVRLPNSRERIWLGSFDSPEKAARAFDAALFCLRGESANFNFPDNPPDIVNGRSLTREQIQIAAVRFANSAAPITNSGSGRPENSNSSSLLNADAPSPASPSDGSGSVQTCSEMTETSLDSDFLDLCNIGMEDNVANFGIFPGFDDFSGEYYYVSPDIDDVAENYDGFSSQDSFLWSF